MKLTCDEATAICDKSQYKEATFLEKIKLNLHIFLCKKCGLYSKQNIIMTKCLDKHKNNKTKYNDCLNEAEKEAMNKKLQEKI